MIIMNKLSKRILGMLALTLCALAAGCGGGGGGGSSSGTATGASSYTVTGSVSGLPAGQSYSVIYGAAGACPMVALAQQNINNDTSFSFTVPASTTLSSGGEIEIVASYGTNSQTVYYSDGPYDGSQIAAGINLGSMAWTGPPNPPCL